MQSPVSRRVWLAMTTIASLCFGPSDARKAQAQSLPAPVLIPYQMSVVAGNAQSTVGGYSGDGGKAIGTTLNAPNAVAVDTVGNVYFADTSNALIREINAQTGIISTVAGLAPTKCTQTLCTATTGYADGVPATSAGIGSGVKGIAVDGFGNVFFSDSVQQDVRVVYHGGTQVANLIAIEDPTAAAGAAAVVPGNVYTIAGIVSALGKGTTSPVTDKVLATKASFHNLTQIGLDGVGNIYISDVSNSVVRVINAQSTTQTFFGVSLAPGFIGSIVNCSPTLTLACPSGFGIGGPAGAAVYGADLAGMGVDQYGNVYQTNTKGAVSIYGGVAYTGGAPLTHLLTLQNGTAPVAGDWYNVLNANPNNSAAPAISLATAEPLAVLANTYNNLVLRASAINTDFRGNIYYLDNHFFTIYRTDVNSQVATRINSLTAPTGPNASIGTTAAPVPCSTSDPTLTYDRYGDGCPSSEAVISGNGFMTLDGAGDLYLADPTEFLIRKISVNNQFPATAVGTPVTQTLQIHFDGSNLPITTTPTTSSPIQIQSGNTDYTIAAAPSCANNTHTTPPLDSSIDCLVAVTFKPTRPGLRTASLQATTANGAVYPFAISGTGTGAALALDGGNQTVVAAAGLAQPTSVAIDALGNQYIADGANNRVVVLPAGNGAQTAIGSSLSNPQGVAVDGAGVVYIADTGNNRILSVQPATGTQTVLASGLSAPQAITVDRYNNVYVADTGDDRIIEIPANTSQAITTLLQFGGLPASSGLQKPAALAVDAQANLYIADPGSNSVYKLPPGGGDLATVIGPSTALQAVGANFSTPDGVAVDAAGNVYIADSTDNLVAVKPASTGPGSEQYNLSFTGLKSPAGLALDPSGNLYVADSGNGRVLAMARTVSNLNFGALPLFQPADMATLTVLNTGTATQTLASPTVVAAGATANFSLTDNCSGTALLSGLSCTLQSNFLPPSLGSFAETLTIAGGPATGGLTANLSGQGINPLGAITLAFNQAPAAGGTTASVTATVAQPHGSNTPSGTVTFVATINEGNTARGGSTSTTTVPLVAASGSSATATLNLSGLLPARRYSIGATYNGDSGDTMNTASPFTFIVPGGQTLAVVSNPVSFTYGSAVPALTGTVTGILPADAAAITYTFITTASSTTPVGTYPITLQLSGGNYLNYVVPPAVTSSGAPATVTEAPAPLTVKANSFTTVYGSQNLTYTSVITGAVNGDKFTTFYTPAQSKLLDVGTYSIVPTVSGPTANYTLAIGNGTLTVTQAGTSISDPANAASVLPTNLASEQLSINVASATSGIPPGTVTLTDVFTPFSTNVANAPVTIGPLTLVSGATTYTPTSTTPGTHLYTASYSGSTDFQASAITTATQVIVDHPDFFLTSPATPIVVLPGTLPGGNQSIPGESSATPETATITLSPILSYTGTISLTCASPSSYVTCSLAPASIIINSTTAQTTVISVSTPATLPTNYTSQLTSPSKLDIRLAFLPLGVLALLPFAQARRRNRLTRLLWLLLLTGAVGLGISGCGSTNVKFYTPVPQGIQNLTVTATDGTLTQTLVMQVSIQ
jgi:sugar lactone lactonase YvrE